MVTNLTELNPRNTLWKFCLPMFISVMFQQFYNIADSMIAGRFAGENALAAVGASYPITVIFMAFAVGSNLGVSVVVSRLFGAEDYEQMKSAIYTAFLSTGVLSIVLTIIGLFFCKPMMLLIHTPENILADGVLYLKIYIYGLIFLFLYNVCTGIFTALGDSKTPLYFLIASSIGNIALDYIFVAWFNMGVSGVAYATFIAQGISAVLALITLVHRIKGISSKPHTAIFSTLLLTQIAIIAIPSIMQQSVISVGNLFVQEIVNRYGSAVVAGYSASIKMNTFAINCFMALGSCLSSYTAQNLGAKRPERLPLGFKEGVRLSIIASIPFFIAYFFFGKNIMSMFLTSDSSEAIKCGTQFLKIVAPMYFFVSIKLMTDGIIRGSGAMAYFVAATIPDLVLRIVFANIFTRYFGSTGIWIAWPFGWASAIILTIIFYRRIITGKFKIYK